MGLSFVLGEAWGEGGNPESLGSEGCADGLSHQRGEFNGGTKSCFFETTLGKQPVIFLQLVEAAVFLNPMLFCKEFCR